MKYRDDRSALRQKADDLEHELSLAERQLRETEARLEQHEREDEQDAQELAKLRAKLAELQLQAEPATAAPDEPAEDDDAPQGYRGHSYGVYLAIGVFLLGMLALYQQSRKSDAKAPTVASALPSARPAPPGPAKPARSASAGGIRR